MLRKPRLVLCLLSACAVLALAAWVEWGAWPDPASQPSLEDADALVILGGGDVARWQRGYELAKARPDLPVVVTGDDDQFVAYLMAKGISRERILHETQATSTLENAQFTKPILDRLQAQRVVLVTNGFHVRRAQAVFRMLQPGREFVVICAPMGMPMSQEDRTALRREKLAAVYYLLVHRVSCF